MPLDLGGGFNNIKWMAQKQGWETDDKAVDLKLAVFDLENIQTGWVVLASGEAPRTVWDNGARGPRPNGDGDWRRGFTVSVYAPKSFGDEQPRTLMTNATGACLGIQNLYAEYENQKPNNADKVPLVKFDGAETTKIGKGSTAIPKLSIDRWVDRPDALENVEIYEPIEVQQGEAPATDVDWDTVAGKVLPTTTPSDDEVEF